MAFLDADDRWAPRNLERQAAFLRDHPEVDITFGHSLLIDEEGRSLGFKSSSCAGIIELSQLLRTNEIGNGSCLLLRREALDRAGWFDTTLAACVDLDVWLRVASLRSRNVVAIPEVLTFYRRRHGRLSSDWRRMEAAYLQLFERLKRVAPLDVQREENAAARADIVTTLVWRGSPGRPEPPRDYSPLPSAGLRCGCCADYRTWLIGLAILCQLLLPRPWYLRAIRWGQRLLGPMLS